MMQKKWLQCGKVFLAAAVMVFVSGIQATDANAFEPGPPYPVVALADLPQQGQTTYGLILRGGPFPFAKDGVVFGNYEKQLPKQKRGYYHEYTVPTPGSRDRGARRIVCGGKLPTQPVACYYTDNHYASFRQIVGGR